MSQNYLIQQPGMTWWDAAKVFFLGSSRKTQMTLVYTGVKLLPFIGRVLPILASFGIIGNDVVGFIFDDPLLIITIPWMLATLAWASIRIPMIHRNGNKHLSPR